MKPSYNNQIAKVVYNGQEISLISDVGEPLQASTDEEMQALLIEENVNKVVLFTGISETYEIGTYYYIGV